ncbi:MAG: hypothetical protein RL660_1684 [Bacteroidota bacterium]
MKAKYKGSSNYFGNYATLKIQCIIDLKAKIFCHFKLQSFCDSDQKYSDKILSVASKGDLVIRDLGYFSISVFKELIAKRIYFITKLMPNTVLYDDKGTLLNIPRLLKSSNLSSKTVYLSKAKIKCRIVIEKLPPKIAAARVRKAKQNRNRRVKYTTEYFKLQAYNILITNVEAEKLDDQSIISSYRIRWTIEMFFKNLKSSFNLNTTITLQHTKCERVETVVLMTLIYYVIANNYINKLHTQFAKGKKQGIQILNRNKVLKFLVTNLLIIEWHKPLTILAYLYENFCYDKRTDRYNLEEIYYEKRNYA